MTIDTNNNNPSGTMRRQRVRNFVVNPRNRVTVVGFAFALVMMGTALFKKSFQNHHKNLLDPMNAELDSVIAFDQLKQKQAEANKVVYKLPPPIKYYRTGNTSTAEFCTHNSNSSYCCSEEHCETIVRRSTLYSECCNNLHNQDPNSRSKIFPLLITSGPRSGTWFMQQLFTKTGLQGLTTDEVTPEHMGTVSWKHIFAQDGYYFGRQHISHLYSSKFRMIWHLVRDPLHSLTSIAFTDPLWEDTDQSKVYMGYIANHIPLTNKTALMNQFNISNSELEDVLSHRTMTTDRNPKLDHFLIWRGMEVFLYWHGFINYLNVPIFRIEDLAIDKNVTVLDEIFKSVGRDPPNHDVVMEVLNAQHRRRLAAKRTRRRLEHKRVMHVLKNHKHQELATGRRLQSAYKRQKRIRKGSRIHRPQLTWDELCQVSVKKTKAMLKMSHSFGYYMDVSLEYLCSEE